MSVSKTRINEAKRIVIKIGSAFLVELQTGMFNTSWLNCIVDEICQLKQQGKEVILVCSGAIALGVNVLKINPIKARLLDKQAASTIGQNELISRIKDSFARHSVNIAQVLLTNEDIENRKKATNIVQIIDILLGNNVVPIVNENDLIATAEMRFGDNDRLSAKIARITNADTLILFSKEDGLYITDPIFDNSSILIKEVYEICPDIEKMAGDSIQGTGGMSAKIAAAKIAMNSGCKVVITKGKKLNPIKELMAGAPCTWFNYDKDSNVKYQK